MAGAFSVKDGKEFVRLARKSIEYFMHTGKLVSESCENKSYLEMRGVFVTLNSYPSGDLRGCIGYSEPIKPLWNAIIECAVSSAFNDPRFLGLEARELDAIAVEVSVLTKPKIISGNKEDLPKNIEIGKDGLIIRKGYIAGLLLPQVAVEWEWKAEEFLDQTCRKAGLEKGCWKEKAIEVFKFQSQIFKEKEPRGKVVES